MFSEEKMDRNESFFGWRKVERVVYISRVTMLMCDKLIDFVGLFVRASVDEVNTRCG